MLGKVNEGKTSDSATCRTERSVLARAVGLGETKGRAAILVGVAAALTLAGSLLKFLNYNHYPVASAEVVLVLAGILAVSVLVALCCSALGILARIPVLMMLTHVAIDLHFDSELLPLFGVAAAVLFNRFTRQALILLFGVVIVSEASIAVIGGNAVADEAAAPTQAVISGQADFAIVHLILDEHIGLEGIPDSLPRGAELREQLKTFYIDHGFRIFGGAYSESLHTVNAIPRALSLEIETPWKKGGKNGMTFEQNPYFDSLQSMGLRIDVNQSDWIDFCQHAAVGTCRTRAAGGLIDVGDKLPTADKAAILIYRLAALSSLGVTAFRFYDVLALMAQLSGADVRPVQLLRTTSTSALNGMASFEGVIDAARSLTPGEAIFAHILLPHFPYAYDQTCQLKRVSEWLGRASAASRELRYTAYFDQVTCATHKVKALLTAVASSPAAGKTAFVIHGDHGSRIMRVETIIENDGKFSGQDLVDGHATFFAVAAPGIEPGYDVHRYPLRLLLDALTRAKFGAIEPELPTGFVPTIAIEDGAWNPVRERAVADIEWWRIPSGLPAAEDPDFTAP